MEGVMIAEGNLHNPALFTGETLLIWDISLEYLDFAENNPPCPTSYARGHVFKLCHHGLQRHTEARKMLSDASSINEMRDAVKKLRELCLSECHTNSKSVLQPDLPFHHSVCQPYVRPPPSKPVASTQKQHVTDAIDKISKKKMKKLLKRGIDLSDFSGLDSSEKAAKLSNLLTIKSEKAIYKICVECGNPGGFKCVFNRCKPCCKKRMRESNVSCTFHRNVNRIAKESEAIKCEKTLISNETNNLVNPC